MQMRSINGFLIKHYLIGKGLVRVWPFKELS